MSRDSSPGATLAHIRSRTRELHERAEALIDLPTLRTVERYRTLLSLLLGFHAPLERRLAHVDLHAVGLDLDARLKALFSPPLFDPTPLSRAEAEDVIIEFFIDPDGGVQLPRIVSAKNKERGWAAATALKRWIFEVPKVNSKPVFVRRELALAFN